MSIEVLMSTYNGEKYIAEQLESINAQTVDSHITIRDDGSTDATREIIRAFNRGDLVEGVNVGSTESFLKLIEIAPNSDYYAFSDQDDIWDNDKLECAILMLKEYDNIPAIYSGNTRLVDSRGMFIRDEAKNPKLNLGSAIVKNYATGCTVVFNRKLMIELKKYHPQKIPFHDWWTNVLCLSIGGVSLFDEKPHISYRQHEKNIVSGNSSIIQKYKSRFNKFIKTRYYRDQMALQILNNYGNEIDEEEKRILADCINGKMTLNHNFSTGALIDDLLFQVCTVLGRV